MTFTAIPREEFERRLEAARELTASLRLDALLVVGRAFYDRPGNLAYLTNYFPPEPTMVFGDDVRGAGHGILLLPRRGAPILFTAGAVPEIRKSSNRPSTINAAASRSARWSSMINRPFTRCPGTMASLRRSAIRRFPPAAGRQWR